MKKIRFHLTLMLSLLCLFVFGSIAINVIVDPYDVFGNFLQFTQRPGMIKNRTHWTKVIKLIQEKPDTIILGTSTVDNGYALPGSTSTYTELNFKNDQTHLETLIRAELEPNQVAYNVGVNGGSLHDVYNLLQHAYLNNPHLKHVIIGLEWHLFTSEVQPKKRKYTSAALMKTYIPLKTYAELALTWHSLGFSWQTAKLNFQPKRKLVKNLIKIGYKVDNYKNAVYEKMTHYFVPEKNKLLPNSIPVYFQVPKERLIDIRSTLEVSTFLASIYYISTLYSLFEKKGESAVLNPEAFLFLQRIVDFAKENNLKIDFYLSPQHATHWITTERFGLQPYADEWIRKVARITQFWDFSGRVDFNDDVSNYFRGDDRHFNYKSGEIILSAILSGKADEKNGIHYVTNAKVEDLIRYRHSMQTKWLQHNIYLAKIFDTSKFSEMRNYNISVTELLNHCQPIYNRYHVFQVLSKFVAAPEEYAPYDFSRFMRGDYPKMIYGQTLTEVTAQIDAQSSQYLATHQGMSLLRKLS